MWKTKRKPTLLLTVGTAVGLIAGGATAWWLLQQRTPIAGLPAGADVLPQTTAVSFSLTTDAGQWRRLRQFGNAETQASFDQTLVKWRDRFFADNGINYQKDIQPWVGDEITVAFLNPKQADGQEKAKEIQPYRLPNEAEYDQSAVMILPIANLQRVQQMIASPKVSDGQEWADRDYKGVKIREVHGKVELDYAMAMLADRFVVVSGDSRSLEQVIDTFKGDPSVARNSDYGKAFTHLQETVDNPFLRLYVNVPEATEFTTNNANQPISPQLLTLLQNNQGLASAVTLESNGVRFQGVTWLPSNAKVRLKAENNAERMPVLLPGSTVLMTSGDNLKQFWQEYSQPIDPQTNPAAAAAPKGGIFSPNSIRQGIRNFTGLDFDKDVIPWTEGEFSLALLSAPATPPAPATAGLLMLVQVNDRRAAEDTFKKLDQAMQEQHGWQVKETQVQGKPATNWTSPFAALSVTRGWLDGNIVYLAIGSNVAESIVPAPAKPLVDSDLFRSATANGFKDNSGKFYVAIDQLANPNIALPLPSLPNTNRATLSAMQAIGVTTEVQDGRTLRYDAHVLLRRSDKPPANLPTSGTTAKPSPSSEANPGASPSAPDASPSTEASPAQ